MHGREVVRQTAGERPGPEAAHRGSGEPISPGVSLRRSRGGLEVVPAGYRAARDGAPPRTQLLWAAAFLLLEAVAAGPPAGTDPALAAELAGLLSEVTRPAPPPPGPPWPAEPLTHSETRVLRYLPTHLGTPQIAAELFLSPNTVKTHLRHLYRKLGAHNRREAVQHARATGLLPAPARRT